MDDELGTALALMHRARASLTTLECTAWTWTDHDRWQAALAAAQDRRRGGVMLVSIPSTGGEGAASEHEARIWFSAPQRCREEGAHVTIVQHDGERWITPRDPSKPIVHEQGTEVEPLQGIRHLVDPRGLSQITDLTCVGRAQVDGREVLELEAKAHSLDRHRAWAVDGTLWGAEELAIAVDLATGVLLRVESRFQGSTIRIEELRSLRTGHRISAARFEPELPAGREQVDAEERQRRMLEEHQADRPDSMRPHQHAVTGPAPTDQDAAREAIQGALDAMFGPHEGDVPGVEGGETLGPVLAAARQRNEEAVEGAGLRLDDVRFLHAGLAEISFALLANGGADIGLQQQGFALEVDGEWLISRETLAALLSMGGVKLPPRTVGLDPPDPPAS